MVPPSTEFRDSPGVVVPPPLIFAGILTVGVFADWFVAGLFFDFRGRYLLATVLGCISLALLAAALGLFRRAGTRPEPWRPTTAIVKSGVYRITRNPMYLGMALAYAAIAIAFGSLLALILLPAAILIIHYRVILREERYLETKFGTEYIAYKTRVRRWI